eukprot:723942-Pelagomonas_calceolata.AAC.1
MAFEAPFGSTILSPPPPQPAPASHELLSQLGIEELENLLSNDEAFQEYLKTWIASLPVRVLAATGREHMQDR